MSAREYAVSVLASLSEAKMREFITLFADDDTLTRIESDTLANDPNSKRYSSFKEFMAEMENELDEFNEMKAHHEKYKRYSSFKEVLAEVVATPCHV